MRIPPLRLLLPILLLAGCRPAAPAEPSPPGSEPAVEASTDGAGSGTAPPRADAADAVVAGAADASPAAAADDVPPLESLMRRAGYARQEELAMDAFVPVPPGARAEAGTFGAPGGETARVLLVVYANRHFARPHVTDVLERRRLLPSQGDAVLSLDAVVVQIATGDRAAADALADRLQQLLGWDQATDVVVPPPAGIPD
jgi:hypothetical protein